jgi:hypothetical protein
MSQEIFWIKIALNKRIVMKRQNEIKIHAQVMLD